MANWLKGLGYRLADSFFPGSQYNSTTGQWTAPTGGQIAGGIGGALLNLVAPGAGTLLNRGQTIYYNHHNQGYGGIDHSTIPTNPTMSVGDLGFPGYSPNINNPFGTPNNNNGVMPPSGDVFDPTGYFGHNDPFKNTAGPSSATQPGGLMGGKTWLTGQDAQDWVEGMRDHSLANARASLDFWKRGERMT